MKDSLGNTYSYDNEYSVFVLTPGIWNSWYRLSGEFHFKYSLSISFSSNPISTTLTSNDAVLVARVPGVFCWSAETAENEEDTNRIERKTKSKFLAFKRESHTQEILHANKLRSLGAEPGYRSSGAV